MSYFLFCSTLLLSWKYVCSFLQIIRIINLEMWSVFKQIVPPAHLMSLSLWVIVQTIVSPLSLNFILSPVHVALFQQCQSPQCGLQAYREISPSLSLSPFPPCRHLRRLPFHVWLLFSLLTKLTTRNVKLCKLRHPQGEATMPTCNLPLWCLSAERSKASEKRRGKKREEMG